MISIRRRFYFQGFDQCLSLVRFSDERRYRRGLHGYRTTDNCHDHQDPRSELVRFLAEVRTATAIIRKFIIKWNN